MSKVLIRNIRDFNDCMAQGLADLGPVKSVLIKPNFAMGMAAESGATTSLNVIAAVIHFLQTRGIRNIAVGESTGIDTAKVFKNLRVHEFFKDYRVDILDFELAPRRAVIYDAGVSMKRFSIPAAVDKYDCIINIPKMKTHEQTTVTLGMKNFFAFYNHNERQYAHLGDLHSCIADMAGYLRTIKPIFTILDATIAMSGWNGPLHGDPLPLNSVMSGIDLVGLDRAAVRWMGGDPDKIKHLCLLPCGPVEVDNKSDYETAPFVFPPCNAVRTIARRWKETIFRKKAVWKDIAKCTLCGVCARVCPRQCIDVRPYSVHIDEKKCVGCLCCSELCVPGAMKSKTRFGWLFNALRPVRALYRKAFDRLDFGKYERRFGPLNPS